MELLKKTILQAVTTGTTITGGTIIIPDLSAVYYVKIGLKQSACDIGFFDAYVESVEPTPPTPPPVETYYLLDSANNIFADNNGDRFVYQ